MSGLFQFRPAHTEEAGDLGELARAVWALAQSSASPPPEELPDFTVNVQPGCPVHAWVAEVDDQPVAFVAVVSWGRRARLEHLWVLPAWQGRGVGRELVRQVAKDFREAGWPELEVLARPEAAGFYRQLGATDAPEAQSSDGVVPLVLQLAAAGTGGVNSAP